MIVCKDVVLNSYHFKIAYAFHLIKARTINLMMLTMTLFSFKATKRIIKFTKILKMTISKAQNQITSKIKNNSELYYIKNN